VGAGLVEALTEGDVSDPVKTVLDEPVRPDPVREFGGGGLLGGQGDDGVDDLGAPGVLLARLGVIRLVRRVTWMAWAAPGKPSPPAESATVTTLRVRSSIRPCPRPVVVCPTGTCFHGSFLRRWSRPGWLPFAHTSRWAPRPVR